MSTSTKPELKRAELPERKNTDPFSDFAKQCKKKLGYERAYADSKNLTLQMQAESVLHRMGIKPLQGVDEYCDWRRKTDGYKWMRETGHAPHVFAPVIIACSVAAILAIIGSAHWIGIGHAMLGPVILPLCGSVLSLIFAACYWKFCSFVDERFDWRWYTLGTSNNWRPYPDPVPEFALQTALDVKEQLDKGNIEHTWWVYELNDRGPRSYDPFLTLRVGEKNYFLEVWNEPKFNEQRSV